MTAKIVYKASDIIPYLRDVVVLDTETSSLRPWRDGKVLGGLGVRPVGTGTSFYIPFRQGVIRGSKQADLTELKILTDALKGRTLVWHNPKFDLSVLYQEGIDLHKERNLDTVVLTRLTKEDEINYSLKALGVRLLGITGGKESERQLKLKIRKVMKEFNIEGDLLYTVLTPDEIAEYVGFDLLLTEKLFERATPLIKERKLEEVYELEIKLTEALFETESFGIKIDVKYITKERDNIKKLIKECEDDIYNQAGSTFNINSTAEVKKIFNDMGFESPRKTPHGADSWNKIALEEFNHPMGSAIVKYRGLANIKNYYENFLELKDKDDIIHPSFHQAGTKTGRFCVDANTELETNMGIFVISKLDLTKYPKCSIITHRGNSKKIISKIYKGREEMFKVSLEGGKEIICTNGHRFLTPTGWKQLRELSTNEQVYTYNYKNKKETQISGRRKLYSNLPKGKFKCETPHKTIQLSWEVDGGFLFSREKNSSRDRWRLPFNQKRSTERCFNKKSRIQDFKISSIYGVEKPIRSYDFYTESIKSIESVGVRDVWDIEVEEDHSYLSQGFVNHNSCKEPNLQNIPRFEGYTGSRVGVQVQGMRIKKEREEEEKRKRYEAAGMKQIAFDEETQVSISNKEEGELFGKVRGAFIPRPNTFLLFIDWSQIELRIFADYAGEADLIKTFELGLDVHAISAQAAFGDMPKDKESELYKWVRTMGKQIAFGLLYGMGKKLLAVEIGKSEDEAKAFMDQYFVRFKKAKAFMKTVHKTVENRAQMSPDGLGYLKNRWGRRRYLPKQLAFKGVNFLVQGSAADLMKESFVRINNVIRNGNYKTRIVNSIHDEFQFEIPYDEIDIIPKITDEMIKCGKFSCKLMADLEWSPTRWAEKVSLGCGECNGTGNILKLKNVPEEEVRDIVQQIMYRNDEKALNKVEVRECSNCNGKGYDLSKIK